MWRHWGAPFAKSWACPCRCLVEMTVLDFWNSKQICDIAPLMWSLMVWSMRRTYFRYLLLNALLPKISLCIWSFKTMFYCWEFSWHVHVCTYMSCLADMYMTCTWKQPEVVFLAFDHFKSGKKDHTSLNLRHFCLAAPVLAEPLSGFLQPLYVIVIFLIS